MNNLPVQMHPKYQEFLAFMADCQYRKTPSTLETAFWAWLNKSGNQSLIVVEQAKEITALKRDLNIKHREVAELQKQLSIMSEEYERVTEKLETRKEFDFLDARIDALDSVFKLASLVQFKYVQDVTEPNESNFKVSMAGGHYTFGEPEQYNEFMDKYLAWLESR